MDLPTESVSTGAHFGGDLSHRHVVEVYAAESKRYLCRSGREDRGNIVVDLDSSLRAVDGRRLLLLHVLEGHEASHGTRLGSESPMLGRPSPTSGHGIRSTYLAGGATC